MNEQIQALTIRKDNLLAQYGSVEISNENSLTEASKSLGAIRGFLKKVESMRVFLTRPLNDHIRNINIEFNSMKMPLLNLDNQSLSKCVLIGKK